MKTNIRFYYPTEVAPQFLQKLSPFIHEMFPQWHFDLFIADKVAARLMGNEFAVRVRPDHSQDFSGIHSF